MGQNRAPPAAQTTHLGIRGAGTGGRGPGGGGRSRAASGLRGEETEAELAELGLVDRRRGVGERVAARLRLREGDHLTDVLLAGEDRDEPVDADREPGVRRRAVAERLEQEAEAGARASSGEMPRSEKMRCWSSERWILTLPDPSSQPLRTRSYD